MLIDSGGSETLLTLTTHYTVSGVGDVGGGNITTVTTYSSEYTLTILRDVPFTQLTDYIENDEFPAESHERGLDKAIMILQQLAEKINRALFLVRSSSYSGLTLGGKLI
jgi:hypothetical protein